MKIWVFSSIVCMYSVDVLAGCCSWWGCCGGSVAVAPLNPIAATTPADTCTPYPFPLADCMGVGARAMAARRMSVYAAATATVTATATGSSQEMAGAAVDVMKDCIGLDSSRPTPRLSKEEQKRIYVAARENPEFLWSSLPVEEAGKCLTSTQEREVEAGVDNFMKEVMDVEPGLRKRIKGLMSGSLIDHSLYGSQVHWCWDGVNYRIKQYFEEEQTKALKENKKPLETISQKVVARYIVLFLESEFA